MSADVVEGLCRLLERRAADLDSLLISWFGGEPLLALDAMLAVSQHASALAARYGFEYQAGATTNGWLLDVPLATRLANVGVSHYQITLDGPPEFHDATRIRASGRGSFDRIWANLWALRSTDLPVAVMVRCHVTAPNASAWPAFAPRVLQLCADPRFRVHVHQVGRWGGPHDEQVEVASRAAVDAVRRLFAGAEAPVEDDEYCYAAVPSAFVVRADGTVGRCTVAVNDPRNRVGRLTPDGVLRLDPDKVAPWFRGWEGDEELLECPLKGLPPAPKEPVLLQIQPRELARR